MMCEFCKDREGNLDTPILDKTEEYGPLASSLNLWVLNNDSQNIHRLWYSVDFGAYDCPAEILEGQIDIKFCPMCGRKL